MVCRAFGRRLFRRIYFWLERHRESYRGCAGKTGFSRCNGIGARIFFFLYPYRPAGGSFIWTDRSPGEDYLITTSLIHFSPNASFTLAIILSFWYSNSCRRGATV